MASISFSHFASAGKKVSTEKIVHNFRKYYPNDYYLLLSDAADDLSDIASKYNCEYLRSLKKLGYPSYDLDKVLQWLDRFRATCEQANTTHIMMVEDDVWIKKQITVHDEWEMAGWDIKVGNIIPDNIMYSITEFSGKRPLTNQYGCGGGAIFKVSTFLANYDRVIEWFKNNHDVFQQQYNPLGYMDCYMVVYYMLCGKDYSVNPYLNDSHHHTNDGYDYDKFVNEQPDHIEIINNYKKYYWVNDEIITIRTI
jgi:hypothetical protein